MKYSDEEKAFLETINKQLDQRVEEIDDPTKDALRRIRRSAIAQATDRSTSRWQWLQPVPIMATISLVLVISLSLRLTMTSSMHPTPALEDIPLLTASDDIEFYNDLEFYRWIEAENLNG